MRSVTETLGIIIAIFAVLYLLGIVDCSMQTSQRNPSVTITLVRGR